MSGRRTLSKLSRDVTTWPRSALVSVLAPSVRRTRRSEPGRAYSEEVLERLPPAARSRTLARAATSPTAIVLTGAGVAIGVAAHSIIRAVVLGACGRAGRMAVALARSARRERVRRPRPDVIDPWAVPEPWRQFVKDAQSAQNRFAQTLDRWPEGPLHDRLALVQIRVAEGANEVWQVAKQGAALASASSESHRLQLSEQIQAVQAERRHLIERLRLDEPVAPGTTGLMYAPE